jgi:hypothetical protein
MLLLSSLALAVIYSAGSGVHKSENHREANGARVAAESGLSYLSYLLRNCPVGDCDDMDDVLDAVASYLGDTLNGGSAVAGSVSFNGSLISIPEMTVDTAAGMFRAEIAKADDSTLQLQVIGNQDETTRTLRLHFEFGVGSSIFNYGVVSKGAVSMSGQAIIHGANNAHEADILVANLGVETVLTMSGQSVITGDLSASNPYGRVVKGSNCSVGDYHFGADHADIPRADPSMFEPFATNVETDFSKGTYTNIRIPAGSNPTFSSDTVVKGVLFIESPNKVTFAGKVTIQGVIATEDPGSGQTADNTLKFTGQSSLPGVDALTGSEFDELKALSGSALLAPGFAVDFSGQFEQAGGTMAAEEMRFSGQAEGTVKGTIISYSDVEIFSMTGKADILIDKSGTPNIPPGFNITATLSPLPATYSEQ